MEYYTSSCPSIYRGIVEDTADPRNLGRCRVRVAAIHGDLSGSSISVLPWARPISIAPVAKGRGSVILPKKGDIVWVMFENENKEYPIYFGGTYAENELSVTQDNVILYLEDSSQITYNRSDKSYTISSGGNGIVISPEGIRLVGNVTVEGSIQEVAPSGGIEIPTPGDGSSGGGSGSPVYIDSSTWINCVKTVKQMLAAKGVAYSQDIYVTYDFDSFKETVHPDCSGTVTAMVALYNNKKISQKSSYMMLESNAFTEYGFTQYDWAGYGALQTGDIIVKKGHVEVFSHQEGGKNYVWNAGATSSVQTAGTTGASYNSYECYWRVNTKEENNDGSSNQQSIR